MPDDLIPIAIGSRSVMLSVGGVPIRLARFATSSTPMDLPNMTMLYQMRGEFGAQLQRDFIRGSTSLIPMLRRGI